MKKIILSLFCFLCTCSLMAQTATDTIGHQVLLETTMGQVRLCLYDDTPLHRDNFLKLVKEGFYDGVLFHRVIPNFMIQAGDSASRHAVPGQMLGDSPESYTVPAEICFPKHFHKHGALAAAREGDDVNPDRASSMSQFYIVVGRFYNDEMLDKAQQHLDENTQGTVKLTPEVREAYQTVGGVPHLDGQYTVFGEVLSGMDVVEAIQWVECDDNDRPVTNVRIIKASVIK